MKLINKHVSTLILKAKMKLAEKGVIVLAEPIDIKRRTYTEYTAQNAEHST